jgi:hypothetical protein
MPLDLNGNIITSSTVSSGYFKDTVITNGLLIHVDAANRNSYSGTGTTWYDLSGNGNNGTLNGSVQYNSENGGALRMTAYNDFIGFGTGATFAPSTLTVEFWFKVNTPTNAYLWHIDGIDNPELRLYFGGAGNLNAYYAFYDAGAYASSGEYAYSASTWYCMSATLQNNSVKTYFNGRLVAYGTGTYNGGTANTHRFGIYPRANTGAAAASIGSYRFYNRILNNAEISNNYYATKARFGL